MSQGAAEMVSVKRTDLDHRLRELAERQHSVVSWRQARLLEATQDAMATRCRSTDWEAVTPRVLRLVGSVATFEQRCMAATVDAGARAAVSHHAAARLWRLPGFVGGEIHTSRPRGGTRRPTDLSFLQGRPGSALMRTLLAARGAGYVAPDSGLEGRFLWLRSNGLPEPERQVDVGGEGWVGRVDFAYRHRRLLIEIDSDIHHTTKLDREADCRRDTELIAAGFRVVRITEGQVWFRPQEAVGAVRRALAASAA